MQGLEEVVLPRLANGIHANMKLELEPENHNQELAGEFAELNDRGEVRALKHVPHLLRQGLHLLTCNMNINKPSRNASQMHCVVQSTYQTGYQT